MTSHKAPLVQLSAYENIREIQARVLRTSGADSAKKVVGRILDAIDLLGPTPYLGPLHHDAFLAQRGYRKLIVGSYVVVYKVEEDQAVALNVFHGVSDYTRRVE